MMMMMMGMNTFAQRKHNFPDRRKGNVIIRPDTKRSSAKITRPVINILDTDYFPKEGWSTCGAHLWRTVIHSRNAVSRTKTPTEYRFSRCTDDETFVNDIESLLMVPRVVIFEIGGICRLLTSGVGISILPEEFELLGIVILIHE